MKFYDDDHCFMCLDTGVLYYFNINVNMGRIMDGITSSTMSIMPLCDRHARMMVPISYPPGMTKDEAIIASIMYF